VQSSSQIITTNKPTSSFLQAGSASCRPTNSVKALKENVPCYPVPLYFISLSFFILFFVLWWYKQNDDDDDDDDQYAPNFHCMDMCYTKRECLTIYSVLFRVK